MAMDGTLSQMFNHILELELSNAQKDEEIRLLRDQLAKFTDTAQTVATTTPVNQK